MIKGTGFEEAPVSLTRCLSVSYTMGGEVSRISATSPPTPDDERWTADYASRNGASANARSAGVHRLVVLGYITAVSMPPIGFILGIVLATRSTKKNSRHGASIIVISVIACFVWILILSSGVLGTASTDY
jgi:hypothetical protein